MNPLARSFRRTFASVVLVLTLAGCQTVGETGRKQFIAIGETTEIDMGIEAYRQALEKAPVSKDRAINDLVQRVGMRIAEASGRSDYKWEFTVVQDDGTVNAWALPGGKVAVYTGILKVTQDEDGLATVLGHEVAHATARHGAERMTQETAIQLVLKGGETALIVALQNKEAGTAQGIMNAFGIGARVGLELPFSRKLETEADKIGLIYMARAGYEPEKAIDFWTRMSSLNKSGSEPPQFLSTHPNNDTRIENIRKWLPEVRKDYKPR